MTHGKTAFTLIVLVALLSLSTAAVAPALKFTFKDVVAPGATETDTYAINNGGVIAGDYADSSGLQHGMILKGSELISFDDPNCTSTAGTAAIQMYGINSDLLAVGWCILSSTGYPTGLEYSNKEGKLVEFSVPGALETEANGINDKKEIVGMYVDSNGVQHGFLMFHDKNVFKTLDPPGVTSLAQAWSINNKGVITVFGYNSASTYVSFTTADAGKTYKPFNPPGQGATGVAIHAINDNGDIDSTIFDTAGNRHGVLLHQGKFYSFDDPNGVGSTRADGLNNTLAIVGRYGSGTYGGTGFWARAK